MKKILDGSEMYSWAQDLFPICRSLTGAGVRETLSYIKKLLPDLDIHEIKSGEKVMDWKVPQEWDIKDAYVINVGVKFNLLTISLTRRCRYFKISIGS